MVTGWSPDVPIKLPDVRQDDGRLYHYMIRHQWHYILPLVVSREIHFDFRRQEVLHCYRTRSGSWVEHQASSLYNPIYLVCNSYHASRQSKQTAYSFFKIDAGKFSTENDITTNVWIMLVIEITFGTRNKLKHNKNSKLEQMKSVYIHNIWKRKFLVENIN